jgi:hypothetical protein
MTPTVRSLLLTAASLLSLGFSGVASAAEPPRLSSASLAIGAPATGEPPAVDRLTGPRSPLPKDWIGRRQEAPDTPILVMAGHADAQNINGSGTSGAAVAAGAPPMYPGISDELYWNMVIAQAVVALGQQRGLRIEYHRPPFRTIVAADDPGTNWSTGRGHALAGGYALEIQFDAWGPSGVGSGLIPPLHRPFSQIDESLAQEFGAYPMGFRDGLGGPRRGVALLEIGKLEGYLEASLRDPRTRPRAVQTIATRVVNALERGLGRQPGGSIAGRPAPALTPPPGVAGSAPRARNLQASSGDE